MTFKATQSVRVMISSRCTDKVMFDGEQRPMSDIRREIKKRIEEIRVADSALFEVWIHEEESHTANDQSCWDVCMGQARKADVFLVLYNCLLYTSPSPRD